MTVTRTRDETAPTAPRSGRWIDHWEPDDPHFWRSGGRRIAWRNLGFSVLAEHLGFNVWILMSVVVVDLDAAAISFTVGQTFWLLILPNLVGATLRIPYTFAIPRFGGRAWTTLSASLLMLPCLMLLFAVTNHAPYWFFLLTAAAMGVGGANFSSSMANISFFFPADRKGLALGLNAAGGNLGAAVTQLLVPLVISWGTGVHLAHAALMWMPLIIVAAVCSWRWMDSLTQARPDGHSYRTAVRNRHTWIVSLLYIGTFGSFVGFSFAFPSLIGIGFGAHEEFVGLAFLGALIGSVTRPAGGWLADRVGGARVTALTFVGLAVGTLGVLAGVDRHSFGLFFGSFIVLFVLTGIGNGSTYRMIPTIFAAHARRASVLGGRDPGAAASSAKRQAAAVVGIAGAVGAFGGVLVNSVFKMSLQVTGDSLTPALVVLLGFYVVCLVTTWRCYLRNDSTIDGS